VVVINSNYGYTLNFYNPLNHRPSGEAVVHKAAVEKILSDACANNEKVLIIHHHSMGDVDFVNSESVDWQNMFVKYSSCIILILSGHSHIDEYRLIKDPNNVLKQMSYIAGSVDSHTFKNPSVRRFFLDRVTGEVLDYDVHYLDLKTATATGNPQLTFLYSARKEYNLADMSPTSFEDLACRFATEPDTLDKHLNHGSSDAVLNQGACNSSCVQDHQCRQIHSVYGDYVRCSGVAQEYTFYALDVAAVPQAFVPV